MKPRELTIPEIALIAGTRAALGAGAAPLLADRLDVEQRRADGWTFVLVRAISTIPFDGAPGHGWQGTIQTHRPARARRTTEPGYRTGG
jgi:hypothetical protein